MCEREGEGGREVGRERRGMGDGKRDRDEGKVMDV